MPSVHPPRDGSSNAALACTSPLLARSPVSVRQWSGSADPVTPADPPAADLPRGLSEMLPVVLVRAFSTASSCTVDLRSELPLATGSSRACALAPSGAGATVVAADPGSPNSVPRSAENHPSAAGLRCGIGAQLSPLVLHRWNNDFWLIG